MLRTLAPLSQSCVRVSRVLADADAIANANAESREEMRWMECCFLKEILEAAERRTGSALKGGSDGKAAGVGSRPWKRSGNAAQGVACRRCRCRCRSLFFHTSAAVLGAAEPWPSGGGSRWRLGLCQIRLPSWGNACLLLLLFCFVLFQVQTWAL